MGVGRGISVVNSYQVIQFRIRGKEGFLCSDLNIRKGRKGGENNNKKDLKYGSRKSRRYYFLLHYTVGSIM